MKLYRLVGPIGAVVAYPFIIVSILLSPWFNFYDNALSDLGNMTLNGPVALVYNSGLVLSGALVASFAFLVSVKNRSWKYLCWSILLTVAGADLALIGIFPEDAGENTRFGVGDIFRLDNASDAHIQLLLVAPGLADCGSDRSRLQHSLCYNMGG